MKIVAFRAVHPMNQNAAFRPAISAHNPEPAVPILHRRAAVRAVAEAPPSTKSISVLVVDESDVSYNKHGFVVNHWASEIDICQDIRGL